MSKLYKLLPISILFAGLWAVQTPAAWACSCALPPPPADALAAADAVFAGTVTAIEAPAGAVYSSADPVAVHFQLLQVWKGEDDAVVTISTARDEAACGYSFQTGKRYLVYAQRIDQHLTVSLCSRTQPLEAATADLAALEEVATPSDQPQPSSPLSTPTVKARQTPIPTVTPIPANSLDRMDVSTWSSFSPDRQWVAERLVALPSGGEQQYYTQLSVRRTHQRVEWMPVAGWQTYGLGYTTPEPLRWSADGRYLYFTNRPVVDGCSPFVNGSDLQRIDLRDGSVTQLLAPSTLVLALSPDESRVAYRSMDGTQLILLDLKTGQHTTVEPAMGDEIAQFGALVWAPDSSALAFTLQHTPCYAAQQMINSIIHLDAKTYKQTPLLERDERLFTTVAWPRPDQLLLTDLREERWSFSLSSQELVHLEAAGTILAPNRRWRVSLPGEPGKLHLETADRKFSYELNFAGAVGQFSWSTDSRRLAIVQTNRVFDAQGRPQRPARPTRLWQVDLGTDEVSLPQLVFSAGVQNQEGIVLGTWSANGRYLLFWTDPSFSASALADGKPLWLLDTETGEAKLVTGQPPLSEDSFSKKAQP